MAFNARWPMRRTRGFSATPRRAWSRKPVKAPSKRVAKAIVRRAGPQEKLVYIDTSFTSVADRLGTLWGASATVLGSPIRTEVIAPADWDAGVESSSERIKVDHLRVDVHMQFGANGTNAFAVTREMGVMLVAGDVETLSDTFTDAEAWPGYELDKWLLWQEKSKSVRVLGFKTFRAVHPPQVSDVNFETYGDQGLWRKLTFIKRGFWLKQPESIQVVTCSHAISDNADLSTTFPSCLGYWGAKMMYSR